MLDKRRLSELTDPILGIGQLFVTSQRASDVAINGPS